VVKGNRISLEARGGLRVREASAEVGAGADAKWRVARLGGDACPCRQAIR